MTFTVTLEPSGHSFEVPDGLSILDAGIKAKLAMPYSCKTGVCRTCRGVILDGKVDYGMVHPNYLPESDKRKGFALLCQAKPISDLKIAVTELEGLAGIETRTMPGRIAKMTLAAPDVMVLQVRLHPNENMRFLAGQYVDVILPDGMRRSYSIASPPASEGVTCIELHLRHSAGGKYTDHVFSTMKERDLIRLEAPLGTFYIREKSAKPIIMVASGTGFAPIKSMCEYMLDRGLFADRQVTLYWGCRKKADLYLLDLPRKWAEEINGFTFHPVLSDPTPDCGWEGRQGFVHQAVCNDFPDMTSVQVYASGTPAMVEAARRDFSEQCNLPEAEFYADSFLTAREKNTSVELD